MNDDNFVRAVMAPLKLEARLDAIPHRRIKLDPDVPDMDRGCHRPDFNCWGSYEADQQGGAMVTLHMLPLWGQNNRYASLSPDEARELATLLNETADAVEAASKG